MTRGNEQEDGAEAESWWTGWITRYKAKCWGNYQGEGERAGMRGKGEDEGKKQRSGRRLGPTVLL